MYYFLTFSLELRAQSEEEVVMKKPIWIALLAFTLLGCQPELPLNHDEATTVHSLVDQGRYSEALRLAEHLVKSYPSDPEYRILLASVYSARAGIKAPYLTPLFQAGFKFNAQLREYNNTPEPRPPIQDSPEELGAYITFIFRTIESVHTLFESVPLLDKSQIPDILMALDVMSYQRNLNADQAVYRAFLRVIYAKFFIEHYLYSGNFILTSKIESCDLNLRDAVGSFRTAANIVADLLVDLAVAWPSSAEGMLNVSFSLQSLGYHIEGYLAKAQWADNAIKRFLRRQIIQFSFAGLLVCP